MPHRRFRATTLVALILLLSACTTAREQKSDAADAFTALALRAKQVHGQWKVAYAQKVVGREDILAFNSWWTTYELRQEALFHRLNVATTDKLDAIQRDIAELRKDLDRHALDAQGGR